MNFFVERAIVSLIFHRKCSAKSLDIAVVGKFERDVRIHDGGAVASDGIAGFVRHPSDGKAAVMRRTLCT